MSDIFEEAAKVVADYESQHPHEEPKSVRQFLMQRLGQAWQQAMIAEYCLGNIDGRHAHGYSAILHDQLGERPVITSALVVHVEGFPYFILDPQKIETVWGKGENGGEEE